MSDLVIKGGLVVDGTGAPGRQADIRVRAGRIAEIGPDLKPDGEQVIDAAGAIVAPGFIDSHTHYDATIFWDPLCDPMPQHGVTSVVVGNCSLGLAPIRAQDRAAQLDCFGYIEDLPLDVLNAAIPWNWEDYGDYARTLSTRELGINVMAFVGHSQIRTFVMGDAAWERAATPTEIEAMAAELDRALAAGAWGLSYSRFDKDRQGRWVPSWHADEAELDALCARVAAHRAIFQFIPCSDSTEIIIRDLEWVGQILARHKLVALYNIVVHVNTEPTRSHRLIACLEKLHSRGARIYAMASPRAFELSIGFEQTIVFIGIPAWNELIQASPEEKRRLIADAGWRARARADADAFPSVMFPFTRPDQFRISTVGNPKHQSWVGRSFVDIIAARDNKHMSDVLADWLQDNDFQTTLAYAIANTDHKEVAALLKSPVTFISGSDAGAHLQMFCASGDATLLLIRFVRERGDMTLEAAIHGLTGHQAELFGMRDRGVLAPGKAGDFTIFTLDELHYESEIVAHDLPGGRSRLSRAPGGYRYTIVNGTVVQQGGKATGALPARWLRKTA